MSDSPAGRGRRPRAVFFGSGSFAVPILDAVADAPEIELAGVVSVPDRAAGRGRDLAPVPVAVRARERGVALLQPATLRKPEGLAPILGIGAEIGVLADFGRIVPADLIAAFPRGILNVHPSLLPRHRGATPIPATILAGDSETGVTIIRMDSGIDTGPIVAAERWPLRGIETAPELEAAAAGRGAALIGATLGPWLEGRIDAIAQDEARATTTRPFKRADGRLDPNARVIELERRVRALQPWPASWVETVAGRLTIWRAEAVPGWEAADPAKPGVFGRFGLHGRDGYLALREVQPAGGKRMTFEELVRGRPAIVGSSVVHDPA